MLELYPEHRGKVKLLALLGALVMVKLLMAGGRESMVITIGDAFAAAAGPVWPFVASYLGALGAFFSGSATISNLTFAGIQDSIATGLGLDRTVMLALQSAGAAMGNMVCINNIVAVCSILGIANHEGAILKRTVVPMVVLFSRVHERNRPFSCSKMPCNIVSLQITLSTTTGSRDQNKRSLPLL